jgi:hypothetical protein
MQRRVLGRLMQEGGMGLRRVSGKKKLLLGRTRTRRVVLGQLLPMKIGLHKMQQLILADCQGSHAGFVMQTEELSTHSIS